MRAREPHVQGAGALLVSETGIVDFGQVAAALGARLRDLGVEIALDCRVRAVRRDTGGLALETSQGVVRGRFLVGCAGLHADRVARLCGVDPGVTIVPFRGEYWQLRPERRHLVRHLVYPVPDPRFPFLGVHFTRRIGGAIEAGPNAVLATAREGYRRTQFSFGDVRELIVSGGFRRLVRRHWRQALVEQHRSWSRRAFVGALQKLVPELRPADVIPGGSGVRAMALDPQGQLVDDFHFVEAEGMIHVLNAPSPAATACLAIGRDIAARAVQRFRLQSPAR
jgi:L-2-hydroxyglutarate oxidase